MNMEETPSTNDQNIAQFLKALPCTIQNVDELHRLLFAPWVKRQRLEFLDVEEGRVRARLFQDPELHFLGGGICGQAMMSGIDTVMSMAMLTYPRNSKGTASQNNQFLRPAMGDDLIIEAVVLKMGKHSAFGETRVCFEGSGELVVHSTSEYAF